MATIREGCKHSSYEASEQLDRVLGKLPKSPLPTLVLGDSAYGFGEYLRMCEKYDSCFILGIKHDAWLKKELAQEDFKKYFQGVAGEGYGYREFIASRQAWASEDPCPNPLLDGLRVIVINLPVEAGETPRFQFLLTNLQLEWSMEEVHLS